MKRLFLLSPIVFMAAVCQSHATTVNFSAAGGRVVQDASGIQIANGDLVWVGTFANTSFSFNSSISLAANIANIEASGGWNQFTLDTSTSSPDAGITNTVTIGGLSGGGRITGTVTDNNSGATKADFFNGKTIYIWVFNASSTAAATQMGIFTGGSGAAPLWTFPVNANGGGDFNTVGTDTGAALNMAAVGGAGLVTASNLKLSAASAIPEPSTWVSLIGATAFLGTLRRRRSTQS